MYLVLRRPKMTTYTSMLTAAIGVPVIAGGAYLGGVVAVAYMVTLAAAINVSVTVLLAVRLLGTSSRVVFVPVLRTAAATVVMSAAVLLIGGIWGEVRSIPALLEMLGTQVSTGIAAFVAALLGLWHLCGYPAGPERDVLDEVGNLLRRHRVGKV